MRLLSGSPPRRARPRWRRRSGGGAVETPGSPNRSSSAAALLESCRARFGERERLRDDDDEWRRFFFFFFSFFWRFFSFFMAFFRAFFLRLRASSSLMDETLDELEREGMVAGFAWGRRCAAGSFWAYAACALRYLRGDPRASSCTRARQGVGAGTAQGSFTQRRRIRGKHESAAAADDSRSVIRLLRTVFSRKSQRGSEDKLASVRH